MLKDARKQPLRLTADGFSIQILSLPGNLRPARHNPPDTWDRGTAFDVLVALGADRLQYGIYHHQRFNIIGLPTRGNRQYHDKPEAFTNLRRRDTDRASFTHCCNYVLREGVDFGGRRIGDLYGPGCQDGITHKCDIASGHGSWQALFGATLISILSLLHRSGL